jgi:hypothetical protein
VKNKLEATRQYMHSDILHKAMDLSYQELLGDAEGINNEIAIYRKITPGIYWRLQHPYSNRQILQPCFTVPVRCLNNRQKPTGHASRSNRLNMVSHPKNYVK